MKKSAKNDAKTFLMLGGGWFGKVCHEVGGFGGSLMVWHSWATWFVMSSYVGDCHVMACMEYMSGACHVMA